MALLWPSPPHGQYGCKIENACGATPGAVETRISSFTEEFRCGRKTTMDRVAQATSILRDLRPEDLNGDHAKELCDHGVRLFGRLAIQQRYGGDDVVAFLKEQAGYRTLLKRLERLQKQINTEHERQKKASQHTGINKARAATLAAIEASCAPEEAREEEEEVAGAKESCGSKEQQPEDANSTALVAASSSDGDAPVRIANGPPRLPPRASIDAALADTSAANTDLGHAAQLPRGSFRRSCGVCKKAFSEVHHFYHRLCPECAELNFAKRHQTADLRGRVAVVTGGRVRIGYEIVLAPYARAATSWRRAASPRTRRRYAAEADFEEWRGWRWSARSSSPTCGRSRPSAPSSSAASPASITSSTTPPDAHARRGVVRADGSARGGRDGGASVGGARSASSTALLGGSILDGGRFIAGGRRRWWPAARPHMAAARMATPCRSSPLRRRRRRPRLPPLPPPSTTSAIATRADAAERGGGGGFPAGKLDETRQPLDLSAENSWSRRLGEVSTPELLHTLAANAVAPFILCSALRGALSPLGRGDDDDAFGHIINVSALEGKFSVGKKGSGHPHTNMSKAALNMLTCTSASGLYQERVLVNAVDTGWITDMAPGGVGAVAATHETHVGPPLDAIDGAARVLDPIFSHANDPERWLVRGKFFKDYFISNW